MEAWRVVVGGAWEWEGLYEWLDMWGRGLGLWAGPGIGGCFKMVGNLEAWCEVVGGAWEWEGLYEWLGMWGCGLE